MNIIVLMRMRDRAFETDDLGLMAEVLRRMNPGKGKPEPRKVEMAFHKARYECRTVTREKRLASQQWLVANNVKRLGGLPALWGEPLPGDKRK